MGEMKSMDKYISTVEELIKLDGRKVTCQIIDNLITDAKISVDANDNCVFICHTDPEASGLRAKNMYGYPYSWVISTKTTPYEKNHQECTHIQLVEEGPENEATTPLPPPSASEIGLTKKELVALEVLKAMISHSAIDYGWSVHGWIKDGVDKSFEVAEVFLKRGAEEKNSPFNQSAGIPELEEK